MGIDLRSAGNLVRPAGRAGRGRLQRRRTGRPRRRRRSGTARARAAAGAVWRRRVPHPCPGGGRRPGSSSTTTRTSSSRWWISAATPTPRPPPSGGCRPRWSTRSTSPPLLAGRWGRLFYAPTAGAVDHGQRGSPARPPRPGNSAPRRCGAPSPASRPSAALRVRLAVVREGEGRHLRSVTSWPSSGQTASPARPGYRG